MQDKMQKSEDLKLHYDFQPAKYLAGSTSLSRMMCFIGWSLHHIHRTVDILCQKYPSFPSISSSVDYFSSTSGSVSSLSLSPAFPQLRPARAFFRRFEGRPHERIKPIHTLNLSTASHPATRYTWRIKRCYVNMEKVVDSCMRRAWISLSCPTSRETDAFVSLASLDPLSRIVLWYACVTFAYLFPTRLFVSNERRSWISIRPTKRTYVAISQS